MVGKLECREVNWPEAELGSGLAARALHCTSCTLDRGSEVTPRMTENPEVAGGKLRLS